jgi:5'(3')-deoxyribonucleotidase
MRILLDMDDVLVDFSGAAARLWGETKARLEEFWEPGHWDMRPALSAALGLDHVMSMNDFWYPLNNNAQFWEGLEWTPWAKELIELTEKLTTDWWVVTAPSMCESSYVGKLRWLRRHFGGGFRRYIPIVDKDLLANPTTCLVDDRDSNIKAFNEAKGKGVLLPRLHNSLHQKREVPLAHVRFALTYWHERMK